MRIGYVILVSALVLLIVLMIAGVMSDQPVSANVAIIPIKGVITSDGAAGYFSSQDAQATDIARFIEDADNAAGVKIILLEINSPGGSAVASDEIARAVEATEKPVVAWIREAGASGAYWVASEADWIIANRMSITGSVGVIASYLEFHDFLSEHNVTYQRLVAGEHKDAGNPFASLSDEEKEILQKKLDTIHMFFLDDVQENRNLTDAQRQEIETGIFFLGYEALELGLVDELGGRAEVRAYLEEQLDSKPTYRRYERQKGFFEELFETQAALPLGLSIRS